VAEIVRIVRDQLTALEARARELEDLIRRLKMAGEDTLSLERQLADIKARIERWRNAFAG